MTERSAKNRGLLHGGLLARNVMWNLLGNGAPMVVAVFTMPILIRELGKDRFGVLALAWALIGYASLFDLGLGRALTQLVAQKLGVDRKQELPGLAWTSIILMMILGLIGTVVVTLVSPWLVQYVLKVPGALQGETLRSFYLLAVSIPIVITTAGLRGLLEAHQRFALINILRIPMGVFSFVGPLFVLPWSDSLVLVVGILVLGRSVALIAHLIACLCAAPELRQRIVWERHAIISLLGFGGWMTVSNVVSPLMVTLDRFLIGALVSVAAVTYYATPYEVITKFLLIPAAVMGVMFPAFSTSFAQDRGRAAALYNRCVKYMFFLSFPAALVATGLARDGLTLWLGPDFAQHSVRVLQWLAVGVFLNCLAQVPFALVQGAGRPDLTAKLHLIELPCYLFVLWRLVATHGIEGAAMAWTLRAAVDGLCLFGLASRFVPSTLVTLRSVTLLAIALLAFASIALLQGLVLKGILLGVVVVAFALAIWFRMLTREERQLTQEYL